MGFKLKVEGPSTIELGTTIITGVKFRTDIPHDSNCLLYTSDAADD